MSVAPAELVEAAREGRLDNLEVSVLNQDPLLLQQIRNTPDPGGVGTVRELNRVSQPSIEAILDWEKETGTVAALAVGLDPVEMEQVWSIGEDNIPEDVVEYTDILEEFRDVFAWNMAKMTTIKDEQFRIPVTDPTPVLRQQYRLSYAEKEILAEQVEERKAVAFIRPSMSEYGAAITMPPKKDEFGNWTLKRPCCDYRMLNKVSVTDRYVLPTPEDIFDNIKDAGVYTTRNLRWGFYQVRVAEEDVLKTAFWGPDGLYEWVVMPFGLKNAPVFFQRIMDKTLRDVRAFARCYIDDIIIFSRSHAEHKVHLREVFQRLRAKGIECHPKKLRCAVKDVSYFGHLVVSNGTAPQDVKVKAITKMVAPTDESELRALLGTYNYYVTVGRVSTARLLDMCGNHG
jgi:hypothetical protein